MNILVIGNGFDLAHGLPTRYGDFLKWIQVVDDVLKVNTKQDLDNIDWRNINEQIKTLIIQYYNKDKFGIEIEYKKLRKGNYWVKYFLSKYEEFKKQNKENWIDFENEMSNVIQAIDNNEKIILDETKTNYIGNDIFGFYHSILRKDLSFNDVRDELYNDLNRLTRLLEIYLSKYVESMEIEKISPDIKELIKRHINVISFNYTDTYIKTYGKLYDILYGFLSAVSKEDDIGEAKNNISFIHGQADKRNNVETNNMVLGINEYLYDNEKNSNIEFIGFKKYFQRIYKGTDIEHNDWVTSISNSDFKFQSAPIIFKNIKYKKRRFIHFIFRCIYSICDALLFIPFKALLYFLSENIQILSNISKKAKDIRCDLCKIPECKKYCDHNVYFYGHSLDITDKDVINELILHDTVHTTIYYYAEYENDKKDLFTKITNLVKIIGQDELIKRTNEKSLEFVEQQEMIPLASFLVTHYYESKPKL
jgi:hypothetical protein